MSPEVWDAMMELRQFLFDRVYFSDKAQGRGAAGQPRGPGPVFHYHERPSELPADERPVQDDDLPQAVIDLRGGG